MRWSYLALLTMLMLSSLYERGLAQTATLELERLRKQVMVFIENGRHVEATELATRAVDISRQNFKEDDPEHVIALANVRICLQPAGSLSRR